MTEHERLAKEEIIKKKWENATIQDNFIFSKTMEINPKLCKKLIGYILNTEIESIEYPEREKTIENRIDSKGVRLDVFVKDNKEQIFDIEMQVSSTADNLAKRMRYYQGTIDTDTLKRGKYYGFLKPVYIIFICPFDPFGLKRHIYTFKETCVEERKTLLLGSETTKIILNCSGTKRDVKGELKNFLKYVGKGIIKGDFAGELNREVTRIKNDTKERHRYMGYEMDLLEQRMLGIEIGEERGEKRGRDSMRAEMEEKERNMNRIIAEKDAEIERLKSQIGQMKMT